MFSFLNKTLFGGKLSGCVVEWSDKLNITAGKCWYHKPVASECTIQLSKSLHRDKAAKYVMETLCHEMIHAYLFVSENSVIQPSHGSEFQRIMNRINQLTGLNISIHHKFYAEVEEFRNQRKERALLLPEIETMTGSDQQEFDAELDQNTNSRKRKKRRVQDVWREPRAKRTRSEGGGWCIFGITSDDEAHDSDEKALVDSRYLHFDSLHSF